MSGKNAVQLDLLEPMPHRGLRRLGRIAVSPVRKTEPIAKFGAVMCRVAVESHPADQCASAQPDSHSQLIFPGNAGEKLPRVLFFVRVRNAWRVRSYFSWTDERDEFRNSDSVQGRSCSRAVSIKTELIALAYNARASAIPERAAARQSKLFDNKFAVISSH